jgi:hypothetical protein
MPKRYLHPYAFCSIAHYRCANNLSAYHWTDIERVEAEMVAQLVMWLSHKHEDPSAIASILIKGQIRWHTLIISTLGRRRQADAMAVWLAFSVKWVSPASLRSCLKDKMIAPKEKQPGLSSGLHIMQVFKHSQTPTYTHIRNSIY